jgi:hypothetical protein
MNHTKKQWLKISLLLAIVFLGTSGFIVGYGHINGSAYAASDVKSLLSKFVAGTAHEATPHGVPTNYDWSSKTTLKRPSAPDSETTYLNFWGQIYFDQSNAKPANTRVAIADCSVWGLEKNSDAWKRIMDNSPTNLSGRAWAEDFQTQPPRGDYYDQRTESDGSQSFGMYHDYTAHYFPKYPNDLVNVGYEYSEFVTGCSARLIKNSNNTSDDRNDASYLLSVGNDWRRSDYKCQQNENGVNICGGIGVGKFIRVTKEWRRAVYSTLSGTDLESKPLPPASVFLNPDGSFGDSEVSIYAPTSGNTSTKKNARTQELPTPPSQVNARDTDSKSTTSKNNPTTVNDDGKVVVTNQTPSNDESKYNANSQSETEQSRPNSIIKKLSVITTVSVIIALASYLILRFRK